MKWEDRDIVSYACLDTSVTTLALGESVRECEDEDSHSQVSSHVGS
jgi:hypothetical protein